MEYMKKEPEADHRSENNNDDLGDNPVLDVDEQEERTEGDIWALAELLEQDKHQNPQNILVLQQIYEYILSNFGTELDADTYTSVQNNLGNVYQSLFTVDQQIYLGKAIVCYEEALRNCSLEKNPDQYAALQNNLGNLYSDLQEDRDENFSRAVVCYKEALKVWKPEVAPTFYVTAQTNLGTLYSNQLTGNRATNIRKAITYYKKALKICDPERDAHEYATLQNNLGKAYSELLAGDRKKNLTTALKYYRRALKVWTSESFPYDYALVQNNIGFIYTFLPVGSKEENLRQSLIHYQEALRFWVDDTYPLEYAMVQNNLGIVYSNLPGEDRNAHLIHALQCYQEASRFWTAERFPLKYAMLQNNKGTAYYFLTARDSEENIWKAIACHLEALRFWTDEVSSLDYALAHMNLGNAYRKLSQPGDHYLLLAIDSYNQALRFYTPDIAAMEYATVQNNLGATYSNLTGGDRMKNLQQSLACYQEALRFRTPEDAPLDYAMTQNNMGRIYTEFPTDDPIGDIDRAIACYKEALHFWTVDLFPFECRIASQSLASIYFHTEDWQEALDTYRIVMDASEKLYRTSLLAESKALEATVNTPFYRQAAFSAALLGKIDESLLILENGKTRFLREMLRLHVARPPHSNDAEWEMFENAGIAFRASQNLTVDFNMVRETMQIYEGIQTANRALNQAIERIRQTTPDFLLPLDLPAILSSLPDDYTALVTFSVTESGSIGFVVSRHNPSVQWVEISFGQIELRKILTDWRDAYNHYLMQKTEDSKNIWLQRMTEILTTLGQELLQPVLEHIQPDITHLILLPTAELFIFPLHALPLAKQEGRLLCDQYVISYAPSTEILASTQKTRRTRTGEMGMYAVVNPTADPQLPFSSFESRNIAQYFNVYHIDEGRRAGTKQRVIEGVRAKSYIHFSCHGIYNWSNPPASYLQLADQRLTLDDLQRSAIDLSTVRLVTMSACESGLSDVLQGSPEEFVSIPAGFLLAGVPCIVSSLWLVPEISTALLIEQFYANHLYQHMDIPQALHQAQYWLRTIKVDTVLQYIKQCNQLHTHEDGTKATLIRYQRYYAYQAHQNPEWEPFNHPYYWAAFTVNGC